MWSSPFCAGIRRVGEVDREERVGLVERDRVGARAVEAHRLQALLARERRASCGRAGRATACSRFGTCRCRGSARRSPVRPAPRWLMTRSTPSLLVHLPAARARGPPSMIFAPTVEVTGRVGDVEHLDDAFVRRRVRVRGETADVEALVGGDDAALPRRRPRGVEAGPAGLANVTWSICSGCGRVRDVERRDERARLVRRCSRSTGRSRTSRGRARCRRCASRRSRRGRGTSRSCGPSPDR